MIDNIIHKGKPGMLKHTLRVGTGTWNAIRKPKHKYYVRAEFRSAGQNKRKRELNLKFNWLHYIDAITTDYSAFMSSWFDSYVASSGEVGIVGTASDGPNLFTDFVDRFCMHVTTSSNNQLQASRLELVGNRLGSFGNPRAETYPTDLIRAFIRVNASNTDCVSTELSMQEGLYLVCTFLSSSDLLYHGGDYKNFEGLRLPPTSDSAPVPQPIFLKINEAALSDYGALRRNSDDYNQIAFRQLHYLRGETPPGYDDSYNEQMWLPLLDSSARDRPFCRTSMQPVLRNTHCLWALGDMSSVVGQNSKIPVKFLGECYDYDSTFADRVEHKDNLHDYPLTTDISRKGKGYIYVDDGNVCYCPITGFALECVIEALPEYSDATGNSFGLE